MSLLALGPSSLLQTIPPSDLVGCGSLLQILMVVGALFLNLKLAKQRAATPNPAI
jgi:hypothetical protein